MPSPPAVITGRCLRQRLHRTRLHHRLGRTRNKNRRPGTYRRPVAKDQSEKTGGTHRRTSSGVISRPQRKGKEKCARDRGAVSGIPWGETFRSGRKRKGGDYTACGLESTHKQVARRDLPWRTRWLARKRAKSGNTTRATNTCRYCERGYTLNFFLSSYPSFLSPPISCSIKDEYFEGTPPCNTRERASLSPFENSPFAHSSQICLLCQFFWIYSVPLLLIPIGTSLSEFHAASIFSPSRGK